MPSVPEACRLSLGAEPDGPHARIPCDLQLLDQAFAAIAHPYKQVRDQLGVVLYEAMQALFHPTHFAPLEFPPRAEEVVDHLRTMLGACRQVCAVSSVAKRSWRGPSFSKNADTERQAHKLVPPAEALAQPTVYVRTSKTGTFSPTTP